jgi:hypothetical protein
MTLLLSLAIEGEKAVDLFDHVPERVARELKAEAERLLEVPKDARVPFLLREMKRIRSQERGSRLASVEEEWLLAALRGEHPRAIRLVLDSLPDDQAERLLRGLPTELADAVASLGEDLAVSDEVREIVVRRFEEPFVAASDLRLASRFDHVVSLRTRDVLALIRGLGLDEMAVAFRGVTRDQLRQLLRNMGGRDERDLIARLKEYDDVDKQRVKQALRDVSAAIAGGSPTTDLPRKVGLDRIARAAVPADPAWALYLARRLPVRIGEEFLRLREEAAGLEMEVAGRLQRATVDEARRLAREERLPPKWAKLFQG